MKNVVIIGSGGHGKVVADIVKANGDNVIGFLDDFETSEMTIGRISDYRKYCNDAEFVIAVGDTEDRERISKSMDCRWYTAIHPTAVVSPNATVGEGSVVAANAVINSDAVVGKHCIVGAGAVVINDLTESGTYVGIPARKKK